MTRKPARPRLRTADDLFALLARDPATALAVIPVIAEAACLPAAQRLRMIARIAARAGRNRP